MAGKGKVATGNTLIPAERIARAILLIRGRKVMLDSDLAGLYGIHTKALNQAVSRNADRFPDDFVFRLTLKEKTEVVTNCDHLVRLYSSLTRSTIDQVLGKQVLRSGTSVGAHYREACRAKSNADFVSKVEGALQELDETVYWLELLQDSLVAKPAQIAPLTAEANQLIAIFVTVVRTVKSLPARK
jgi:four helix bundle protein